MAQLVNTRFEESPQQAPDSSESGLAWQTAPLLTAAGAVAIGLPDGCMITNRGNHLSTNALVPTKAAVQRLEQARTVTRRMSRPPITFACTDAREARSLTNDEDARDRRYLSGVRAVDGRHVYCGGIDASIGRALAYAPYADVVCYRASRLELSDAERFASAIRAAFPDKQLGVGFSPWSHGLQSRSDDVRRGERLSRLGYDYYFFTFSESVVFPAFPHGDMWILFDDRAECGEAGRVEESRSSGIFLPSFNSRSG
jgi:isocitrate lyase